MKLAVIETGGKQYLVSEGQKIQIEKLEDSAGVPLQAGVKLDFDKVLLLADGDKVEVGKPYLSGKKVSAELLEQRRLPTVITYKYHSKTRYRNKKGHRQPVTLVKILGI
ncbi:MAG: 50S ribosomal protein L21 [bacterium]|nr:50S ribosomal protein L21 [bacterium]